MEIKVSSPPKAAPSSNEEGAHRRHLTTAAAAPAEAGEEETKLREELGLCYRTLFKEGIYEGCDTHLSLALEGQNALLTLPYGILWSTVQPSDFVLMSFDGKVLKPSQRINQITGEPHEPDITAVTLHAPLH